MSHRVMLSPWEADDSQGLVAQEAGPPSPQHFTTTGDTEKKRVEEVPRLLRNKCGRDV